MQKGSIQFLHGLDVGLHASVDAAVERIADNRVADGAEVHANLMRAPGVNGNVRERERGIDLEGSDDARDGLSTSSRAIRHPLSVVRVASNWVFDTAPCHHHTPDQRHVLLLDLAILELTGKLLVRRVVLGYHHQPRGAAIQSMHDARASLAADATQIVDMMEQRIHQRPGLVSSGGMHDHAGGLVDDDDVRVLIDDRERQVFRRWLRIDQLRQGDGDRATGLDAEVRLRRTAVNMDEPFVDEPLQLRPGLTGELRNEEAIEALPVVFVGDGQGERLDVRQPCALAPARARWISRER